MTRSKDSRNGAKSEQKPSDGRTRSDPIQEMAGLRETAATKIWTREVDSSLIRPAHRIGMWPAFVDIPSREIITTDMSY